MKLDALKYFVQIIEERNISKVAQLNHISQSALSQSIKSIENELDKELIERSNRGITPTHDGEIFYRHAKNINECFNSMMIELNNKSKLKEISIYSHPLFSNYSLPCTLFECQRHMPEIQIDMFALPSELVEQKIISGLGDIGFINGKPHHNLLKSTQALKDPIHLVSHIDYDIPAEIDPHDLVNYSFVMSSGQSMTKNNIENQLKNHHIDMSDLSVKYHMDSIESVKLSVLNQYGVSFLPYSCMKKELYLKQIKIVKIKNCSVYNETYMIVNNVLAEKNPELKNIIQYLHSILSDSLC